MTESHATFSAGGLQLAGLIALPEPRCAGAAVVCHPHPMYGGSMHNNVVEAVLEALWSRGYATLRFNFRGVDGSEGEYDGGEGELDDARAAVQFLAAKTGGGTVTLAGYSFGASVALRSGLADPSVERVIAVALPVAVMRTAISIATKPVLLISGDRDSYSPLEPLRAVANDLGASARVEVVAGADHFFAGSETSLSAIVAGALANH